MTKKKVVAQKDLTLETENRGDVKYRVKILRTRVETAWVEIPICNSPQQALRIGEGIADSGGPDDGDWYEEEESFAVDLIEETVETIKEWMK